MERKTISQYLIKFIKVVGIFNFTLLISCEFNQNNKKQIYKSEEDKKYNLIIDSFMKLYDVKDTKSWSIESVVDFGSDYEIILKKICNDTLQSIRFNYNMYEERSKHIKSFRFLSHIVNYKKNGINTYIHLTPELDTLYHYFYKNNIPDLRNAIFIKGKSRYYYDKRLYTKQEESHYLDSLNSM